MYFMTDDIIFLRTSSELAMDRLAPPSYEASLAVGKGPLEDDLLEYLESAAEKPTLKEQPPKVSWLVRSGKQPSALKLLTGPVMSNAATTSENPDSPYQRRYRVIWPRGYEDVYL